MSVYSGWQHDLLGAASLPDTAANRRFLNAWHANAESDCSLNPIDLTDRNDHSHNCKQTGFVGRSYQRYDDRVWTRTAFYAQITSGKYPHLRAALRSGNPYTVTDYVAVTDDIGKWASQTFSNIYLDVMRSGGPPPTLKAPQALRGWGDIQRAVNRHLPAALHASQQHRHAALRELRRARRVRL